MYWLSNRIDKTNMKKLLRYICILFFLCFTLIANAQMTLELADMSKIGNTNQWKYGNVTCTGNNVTSIILSMINNKMDVANPGGITPSRTIKSAGNYPRTILYLFTTPITPGQVKTFIEGMTFTQTTEYTSLNSYVNISVDANPTRLPANASTTITVWDGHPDGSTHYYVWVDTNSYIGYMQAYNEAKSYYFQGMRGYLPTITSLDENTLLTQISPRGGWSAGARTTATILDPQSLSANPVAAGTDFKWLCGPERGFSYYRGLPNKAILNGAYSGWPPAGNQPDGSGSGENSMQINFGGYWNDLPALQGSHATSVLTGYFIEFGGNGKAYTVGSANYPANTAYNTPTNTVTPTTNAQWQGFLPGNKVDASTTFKLNSMRSNVLVIE